jgi:hypothetical protein
MPRKAVLPNEQVFTQWKCHVCNTVVDVSVLFFQDNGTPVCTECDDDMEYDHVYWRLPVNSDKLSDTVNVPYLPPKDATKISVYEDVAGWNIEACDDAGRCTAAVWDCFFLGALTLRAAKALAVDFAKRIGRADLADKVEVVRSARNDKRYGLSISSNKEQT